MKKVCGVGVNDADYVVCQKPPPPAKRVWCPFYAAWRGLLNRVYSHKALAKCPTYQGCVVADEWHSFMNFRAWMIKQAWEGAQLDKDILVSGNKVYGPDTCVFVSSQLNTFYLDCGASGFLGATWHKASKKYRAQIQNPFTAEREHLGLFQTEMGAHMAWKARKHELACMYANTQTDQRIANALRTRFI